MRAWESLHPSSHGDTYSETTGLRSPSIDGSEDGWNEGQSLQPSRKGKERAFSFSSAKSELSVPGVKVKRSIEGFFRRSSRSGSSSNPTDPTPLRISTYRSRIPIHQLIIPHSSILRPHRPISQPLTKLERMTSLMNPSLESRVGTLRYWLLLMRHSERLALAPMSVEAPAPYSLLLANHGPNLLRKIPSTRPNRMPRNTNRHWRP
jgi:hypothetical protein